MKSIFFRLLIVVCLLVASIIGIGYLLPRDYAVSAEIEIDAAPAEIFPLLNHISNWRRWSSWNDDDNPSLNLQYGTTQAGVDASQVWTDGRRSGKMWITNSQLNRCIEFKLQADGLPASDNRIELIPTGGGTQVIWSSQGRLPSGPLLGYFNFVFPYALQAEYDKGLSKLKSIVEADQGNSAD